MIDGRYKYQIGQMTKYGFIYNYPMKILAQSKSEDINAIFGKLLNLFSLEFLRLGMRTWNKLCFSTIPESNGFVDWSGYVQDEVESAACDHFHK